MGKIYFRTTAYNAEKTLARCVDSVLNQTKYGDRIEYWICDNGSTDSTREMIEEYARKDPRIKMFHNDVNYQYTPQSAVFSELPTLLKDDDFICWIDSDDEYKTDFLEKMIPFISENDLDVATGGNEFVDAETGQVSDQRVLSQSLILDTPKKYAENFYEYHQFARTVWGKIYSGKVSQNMATWSGVSDELRSRLYYGFDTYAVFSVLKHSKRMGIYPEAFYKYYVSNKSVSYKWDTRRFNSNIFLHEDAEDYLKKFGPISKQNRIFLSCVFANAVSDSLMVLCEAQGITAEEKLKELRKAVDYRETSAMMTHDNEDVARCRKNIFNAVLNFGMELNRENEDLRAALTLISPNCAPFVAVEELELYAREQALQNALLKDDATALVEHLLSLISKGAYTKQFDLFRIVERASADRGLASEITDSGFIKTHSDIFLLIWKKKYLQALDKMTGLLQDNRSLSETFFSVYLTLAALLESVDEFVFGKVRLAGYYCDRGRIEECRAVLDDLADMGVEDNDEIAGIRAKLK